MKGRIATDRGAMLLPGEVTGLAAGKPVEHARLELMHQLARLSYGRDQVVAAPSDEIVANETQELEAHGIVVLETGEEPAVELVLLQGLLDGLDLLANHTRLLIGRTDRR